MVLVEYIECMIYRDGPRSNPCQVIWELISTNWPWSGLPLSNTVSPAIFHSTNTPHSLIILSSTLYFLNTGSVVK
jgi:hypothetical protein